MNSSARVTLLVTDPSQKAQLTATLETYGYLVATIDSSNFIEEVLRRERPQVLVVASQAFDSIDTFARLGESVRLLKIASVAILEPTRPLVVPSVSFDDWVDSTRAVVELPFRIERLLARKMEPEASMVDPRFLALVVHDLRTPLNVIGLTVRAISHSNPSPSAEFAEDLLFLSENAKQIEKMLAQLGDFCRLIESERNSAVVEFQPNRFLAELLEDKQAKRDSEYKAVRLEILTDSPVEVALDPNRARLAISHALANAVTAAGAAPVTLRSRGPADRWTIEVVVEKSPPPTTSATQLYPHLFERLIGSAAERRGLDLAIAASVSELFGGSATLKIEPGVRSVVSLEWPARIV